MDRWKAEYLISNIIIEEKFKMDSKVGNIAFELEPGKENTIIRVFFDSETSKPPIIQKGKSKMLLLTITNILTFIVGNKLDIELSYIEPVGKETQKRYEEMEDPTQFEFKIPPNNLGENDINLLKKTWNRFYSGYIDSKSNDMIEYHILNNVFSWYKNSKESQIIIDKFISLWIVFNMLYNYIWNKNMKDRAKSESEKISYLILASSFFTNSECKKFLFDNPYLCYRVMPEYEFMGTREEFERIKIEKDINALEKGHEKYIEYQRKELGFDPNKVLRNKYGLAFGKHYVMEEWICALNEAVLLAYGLRNIIFHEGERAPEYFNGVLFFGIEEMNFWDSMIKLLDFVNQVTIKKILSN